MITDLRLAWRMFLRGRGASVLTVAMLAVAIAGTLTLFTVLTAMNALWPDIPERERLARIYATNARLGVERDTIPVGSFVQWAPQVATQETLAAFAHDDRPVDAMPDVSVQAVTARYFDVFRVQPIAGRTLSGTDADDRARTAVLSERLARLKFGSPADAIGRFIALDSDRYTIVGVMPGKFYFPTPSVQVWIPLVLDGPPEHRVVGIGRLRAGKKWSEAAAELSALAQHGNGSVAAIGWTIRPIPLDEDQRLRTRNGLMGLLGPALVVLLIACVNATNLMLARGVERDGEFAVRLALGASRARIARQLVLEGAVVAGVAATAGVFAVLVLGLHVPGDLDLAWRAPRRPEIEQDDLALVVRKLDLLVVNVLEREAQIRGLRLGETPFASRREDLRFDDAREPRHLGDERRPYERRGAARRDGPPNP